MLVAVKPELFVIPAALGWSHEGTFGNWKFTVVSAKLFFAVVCGGVGEKVKDGSNGDFGAVLGVDCCEGLRSGTAGKLVVTVI